MAVISSGPSSRPLLREPEFKEKLQLLRQTDNFTNWYYLGRTYLFLALVLGGTVCFYQQWAALGLAAWWCLPVTLLAILLVGAGQHQLGGLAHEAVHHTLFRNRHLNELISDWLCLFPLFSSTHQYRLQHLAHHQFVNDPHRDPDVSQLQASGHWLSFPLPRRQAGRILLQQAWPPRLVRYIRARARYSMFVTERTPYVGKGCTPSRLPMRLGFAYVFLLTATLGLLVCLGSSVGLVVAPLTGWLLVMTLFLLLPERLFSTPRIRPVYSQRVTILQRMTFITGLATAISWLSHATGVAVFGYFLVLWILPIFTSYSFFMVLRQLVQHGNGGRGWMTNTRVFLLDPLLRFAVFPIGQDYHLPHHLYATVPHYRLPSLHELLQTYPEYRDEAVVVEGYFLPSRHSRRPTVLDVLGPDFAPPAAHEVHIDNTVLDNEQVEEREDILREAERSHRRD